jgi:ribosome-associated protein
LVVEKKPASTLNPEELVKEIANAAWEKHALNLVAIRVNEIVDYTDYCVVCSGNSDRQVDAIAESIEQYLKQNYAIQTHGIEGRSSGRWVLLDYVDVIVHVMHQPVRDYYEIERLWSDAPTLELQEPDWLKVEPESRWGV